MHFLLVPLAPSSTINKSVSTRSAPISVPPSISKVANPTVLLEAVIILFVSVLFIYVSVLSFYQMLNNSTKVYCC